MSLFKRFDSSTLSDFFIHVNNKKQNGQSIYGLVHSIIDRVKKTGNEALFSYTQEFDGVSLSLKDLSLSPEEIEQKSKSVDVSFIEAIDQAISNIKAFHQYQTIDSYTHTGVYGEKLSQKVDPLESAAIYVPGGIGGKTPLISSLLMNAIPAKLAGCKRIVGFSPPMQEKTLNVELLYTFKRLGINEVYKVGGAQAVAAAAYGTQSIDKCDIIVGPGNAYVTTAKKIVYGDIMIDGIFGPSEIVLINDGSGNPVHLASDLISQAEHAGDELSVLLTTDSDFADEVETQVKKILVTLERKDIIEKSLAKRSAVVILKNINEAIDIANKIAPEHLELSLINPHPYVEKINRAGAIFVGDFSPEPIGDYIAGTNHVLPTNGSARFSSPLGVYNFLKRKNVIEYNREAFEAYAPHAITLARAEKLTAHANALEVRNTTKAVKAN